MKFLFYVHSNITYLASISLINEYKIKDPIIVFGRNFNSKYINSNYKIVYLSKKLELLNKIPTYGDFFLIRHLLSLIEFYRLIREIDSKYILFLPHSNNILMQMFINNRNCYKYNYIDEGLLSYSESERFHKKTNEYFIKNSFGKFMRYVYFFNHLNLSSYFKESKEYDFIYLFFNNNENILKGRLLNLNFVKDEYNFDILNGKDVFILDDFENEIFLNVNQYLRSLELILKEVIFKSLIIKFHPSTLNKQFIFELLDRYNINYLILDDDFPIELYLIYGKNINIHGFYSSILFYSAIFKQNTISYLDKIYYLISEKELKLIPNVFFKKLNLNI